MNHNIRNNLLFYFGFFITALFESYPWALNDSCNLSNSSLSRYFLMFLQIQGQHSIYHDPV